MKASVYALSLAVVLAGIGCSDSDSESGGANPAPNAAPAHVEMNAPATGGQATAPPPGGAPTAADTTPAAAPSAGITPQLTPIQNAIQAFETKNGRMPDNVAELVQAGFIQQLPKLPAGQIYYIDHATKQVKIGSDP